MSVVQLDVQRERVLLGRVAAEARVEDRVDAELEFLVHRDDGHGGGRQACSATPVAGRAAAANQPAPPAGAATNRCRAPRPRR